MSVLLIKTSRCSCLSVICSITFDRYSAQVMARWTENTDNPWLCAQSVLLVDRSCINDVSCLGQSDSGCQTDSGSAASDQNHFFLQCSSRIDIIHTSWFVQFRSVHSLLQQRISVIADPAKRRQLTVQLEHHRTHKFEAVSAGETTRPLPYVPHCIWFVHRPTLSQAVDG